MYSDDSYHSESEFYYPDELNVEENQPISASTSHIENDKTGEIATLRILFYQSVLKTL